MCTDSLLTCLDYLNMEAFPPKQTIYSWVTTWTEVSSHLRLSSYYLPTKSNLKRIFSCSGEIMNAVKLIESTASTMNVKIDILSDSGKNFKMFSTVCQSLLWSMTRFSVCTEVYPQNLLLFSNSSKSHDQQKSPKMDFCATYFGLTLKKASNHGEKTTEEFHTRLVKRLLKVFWRKTISTWFVEHTK